MFQRPTYKSEKMNYFHESGSKTVAILSIICYPVLEM